MKGLFLGQGKLSKPLKLQHKIINEQTLNSQLGPIPSIHQGERWKKRWEGTHKREGNSLRKVNAIDSRLTVEWYIYTTAYKDQSRELYRVKVDRTDVQSNCEVIHRTGSRAITSNETTRWVLRTGVNLSWSMYLCWYSGSKTRKCDSAASL